VQAEKLSSLLTGTVISMKLAWGPVTELYTRHMYALINSAFFLNSWITLTEEARGELLFWQQLPRLRFDADIWPPLKRVSIRVDTDGSDFAWGGHTMTGPMELAREYFSEWEAVQSSTYRELLGVYRCMQSMVHRYDERFVVLRVNAQHFLGS
jgi:hypothetical protein